MRQKKLILIVLLWMMIVQSLQAQINIQITGNSRPTSYLADWSVRKDVFTLIATGGSAQASKIKFKVAFVDANGTAVGNTNLATAPVFTLTAGIANIFNAGEVLALQSMIFTGTVKDALAKTGRLPEGNYQFCVRAVTATDFVPLSEIRCFNLLITSYQLPVLIMPANETKLDVSAAKVAITFRWTPLSPTPNEAINYRLQVFEIMEKQTPMQAFRSNQPLLDKEIIGVTQYIWQPQLDFSELTNSDSTSNFKPKHSQFIWTIQTIDKNGNGFNNGVGDGRSETFVFFIEKKNVNLNK